MTRVLKINCISLNNVILAEVGIQSALDEMVVRTDGLRKSRDVLLDTNSLRDISLGRSLESSLRLSYLLRQRQQTGGGRIATAFNLGHVRELMKSSPDAYSFFLTSSSLSDGDNQTLLGTFTPTLPSTSTLLCLDRRRMESTIAERVDEGRIMVGRNKRGYLRVIESKRRCFRDLPPRMNEEQAISLIQNVARVFLSLKRFKRRAREREVLKAALTIQRVIRGFLGRCNYKAGKNMKYC